MAKTGKEYFDEIATIYSISQQGIFIHRNDKEKIQAIAACSALLAIRLCRDYNLDVIETAPHIPYWIWRIQNFGADILNNFPKAELPQDADSKKRAQGIRQGGIDYTSHENIHKVIDPLFLNDLKEELANIKTAPPSTVKARMLMELQNKLADIKFFDPAAGCGNFLVESYVSLRKLENEILAELESLKKELQTVEESR